MVGSSSPLASTATLLQQQQHPISLILTLSAVTVASAVLSNVALHRLRWNRSGPGRVLGRGRDSKFCRSTTSSNSFSRAHDVDGGVISGSDSDDVDVAVGKSSSSAEGRHHPAFGDGRVTEGDDDDPGKGGKGRRRRPPPPTPTPTSGDDIDAQREGEEGGDDSGRVIGEPSHDAEEKDDGGGSMGLEVDKKEADEGDGEGEPREEKDQAEASPTTGEDADAVDDAEMATIAFRLPPGCHPTKTRITGRFRADDKAKRLVSFLLMRSSSNANKRRKLRLGGRNDDEWFLCRVVGGGAMRELPPDRTLRDLDLVPRGLVVVVRKPSGDKGGDGGARSRRRKRGRGDAAGDVDGVRRATASDRARWDEERSSRDRFGGFDIYGHRRPDPTSASGTGSTTLAGRPLPSSYSTASSSIPAAGFFDDSIREVSVISHLPGSSEALRLLDRLRREFEPVVRARGWTVRRLSEMCCCGDGDPHSSNVSSSKGSEVGGYCVSSGDKRTAKGIHVRLRPPGTCGVFQFLPYDQLVSTMAHELAHIAVGPHNDEFFDLMAKIEGERVDCIARGSVRGEDGFPVTLQPGRRLGDGGDGRLRRRVGDDSAKFLPDLKKLVAEAASERQRRQSGEDGGKTNQR